MSPAVPSRPCADSDAYDGGARAHALGQRPGLSGPRHFYRVERLAATLRAALPRGHVLDAGCGAGTLTIALARAGTE